MSRKQFMESLGATCSNWYWSWSFINKEEKTIIFGEWRERPDGFPHRIFSEDWEFRNGVRNKGYDESRENIRLIEEEGYKLKTFPMIATEPPEGSDESVRIDSIEEIVTEKKLRRDGRNWFADDIQTAVPVAGPSTLKDTLHRIAQLQPKYSSENTPEMAERGFLIRTTLAGIWRGLIPGLRSKFAEFADDIETEGSDGIGRKTEAPWVRMFSKELSPNPREGFYIVVHFSADGRSIYITVGCGSTIWSGGDLKSISDDELKLRTDWARKVVVEKWGSLDPFTDVILLGAKAPLPRTFEKATAFAKRFSTDELDESALEQTIAEAAERLTEIYRNQKSGRDITPGDEAAAEIQSISKPLRAGRSGQGFGLKAPERKAIELQAMSKAEEWLVAEGYKVKDTHLNQSYDFIATKDGEELLVEVKGTISDFCDSILMTKNEVELHRSKKGKTALILVSRIRLERGGSEPKAFDGHLECFIGWDIDSWTKEPIAFQVSRLPVAIS